MFTKNSIYIVGVLFAIGLLTLLIINPVLDGYIKPALLSTASYDIVTDIEPRIDFVIKAVKTVPYSLFFIGILYLLILIFRKEKVSEYA